MSPPPHIGNRPCRCSGNGSTTPSINGPFALGSLRSARRAATRQALDPSFAGVADLFDLTRADGSDEGERANLAVRNRLDETSGSTEQRRTSSDDIVDQQQPARSDQRGLHVH